MLPRLCYLSASATIFLYAVIIDQNVFSIYIYLYTYTCIYTQNTNQVYQNEVLPGDSTSLDPEGIMLSEMRIVAK